MARRSVLVTVTEAASATGRGAEGLRAALGIARGFEGHRVRLLFRGDGVRWLAKSDLQKSLHVAGILAHLRATSIPWYADGDALEAFEVAAADGVQVVRGDEMKVLLDAADACLFY